MSKLQVGRVFLSHTFAKKKFGQKVSGQVGQIWMSILIKVCKIPISPPKNSKNYLYVLKLLEIEKALYPSPPPQTRDLPPSWMFLTPSIRTNFNSKMSKLLGQEGRVDKRELVQTFFCLYQGTRQVGQILFGHMSKILQGFFLECSPNLGTQAIS